MSDVNKLVGLVFSGLSPLVIQEVKDEGKLIWVRARTPGGPGGVPGLRGADGAGARLSRADGS